MAQLAGEVRGSQPEAVVRVLRRPTVFWLIGLVLCLLPLEWWLLPNSLKVADFGLILLVGYGSLLLLARRQRVSLPLWAPFWMILAASVLATLTGAMHSDSLMAILQEIYLYIWFVVLANLLSRFPPDLYDALLKLWSVLALTEAAATLLGMLHLGPAMFYTNPNGNVVMTGGELDRAVGTFANANAAATFLFIGFFVLLAAPWPRWFKIVGASWLLAGIFATGSMGALLATVIGLGALVLMVSAQKNRSLIEVMAVVVGIIFVLIALNAWISLAADIPSIAGSDLYRMTVGRLPRSLMSRVAILQQLWPVYLQYPLGFGPNTSAVFFGSLHNDYAAFLFERGPLGLAGWLWMIGAALALPLRAIRRAGGWPRSWVILALGAALIAASANAFTHELAHFRQVWMLLAFLVAAPRVTKDAP